MPNSRSTVRRSAIFVGLLLALAALLLAPAGCFVGSTYDRAVEPTSMSCEDHVKAAEHAEALAAEREAASRRTGTSWAIGTHWTLKNAAKRERQRAAAHYDAVHRLMEQEPAACSGVELPELPPPSPPPSPPTRDKPGER